MYIVHVVHVMHLLNCRALQPMWFCACALDKFQTYDNFQTFSFLKNLIPNITLHVLWSISRTACKKSTFIKKNARKIILKRIIFLAFFFFFFFSNKRIECLFNTVCFTELSSVIWLFCKTLPIPVHCFWLALKYEEINGYQWHIQENWKTGRISTILFK